MWPNLVNMQLFLETCNFLKQISRTKELEHYFLVFRDERNITVQSQQERF